MEVNSFVGRRSELGEVKRLLADSRLVTLTGVGGVGKTRLALRGAAQLSRAFPDGVWFVDLTTLQAPGLFAQGVEDADVLADLVRAALELPEHGGGPPLRRLADQLAPRQLLLVLDNCEHVVEACAVLADALLRAGPNLRILATSREPLTIGGEMVYPVPPLPSPEPKQRPNLTGLAGYGAVALFVARAQAVAPGFDLSERDADAVAALCRRLDGLPLAIELAAARIRVLAPQQILDRLTDQFALLSGGSRGAPERQQALQACMDWSYELCSKPERILWARLSVFATAFELDAVQDVCADDDQSPHELLDLVAALVDKSVLLGVHAGGTTRYRMLETIRAYGRQRLIDTGEQGILRRRHRDWYQELVTRARAEWISDRQPYWLARLRREHANLRAAVEFCLTDSGEADAALRLTVTVPVHYWWGGLFGECRRWVENALALTTARTVLQARAVVLAGQMALAQGEPDAGIPLLAQGQDLAERLNAVHVLAQTAMLRGLGQSFQGDVPGALTTLDEAMTLLSAAPEPELDQRLELLLVLAVTTGLAGNHEGALAYQQEVLTITQPRGECFHRAAAFWAGGVAHAVHGNHTLAAAQIAESLRLRRSCGLEDQYSTALCLETLAWIMAGQRSYQRAAVLLGAADALWTELRTPITSYLHFIDHHNACQRRARDSLGDRDFHKAFQYGQALAFDDMVAYALDEPSTTPATPPTETPPLTRREKQIADLVAQGLSNNEIASRLVISQRTAESHVEHILTKLGFTSRSQVAAWIARKTLTSHYP